MTNFFFKYSRLLMTFVFAFLLGCEGRDVVAKIDFTVDLNQPEYQQLQLFGGQKLVNNILIFRDGNGNYHALYGMCTYDNCLVEFQVSQNEVTCPCHTCKYDVDGLVTMQPAVAPLTHYFTSLAGSYLRVYSQ